MNRLHMFSLAALITVTLAAERTAGAGEPESATERSADGGTASSASDDEDEAVARSALRHSIAETRGSTKQAGAFSRNFGSYTDERGQTCRVYYQDVTIDGSGATAWATVCRASDGRWAAQ